MPNRYVPQVKRIPETSLLAFMLWVNYQSKYLEFCDTLFMLLRRKFDQVSLLHVSHHVVMGPIIWLICAYAPGGTRCVYRLRLELTLPRTMRARRLTPTSVLTLAILLH